MSIDDFDFCDERPPAETRAQTGRVLVAEDDGASNTLLTQLFSQYGFQTDNLSDDTSVRKQLQEHPFDYDIVCLDWHLNESQGDEFIAILKDAAEIENKPLPRIIVITGDESLRSRAGEFDGFLLKPYSTKDLHAILNHLGFAPRTSTYDPKSLADENSFDIDQELLVKVAMNSPNATAIITTDCQVTWANNAFCILIEELPNALTGTSFLKLVERHCPNQMESYLFQSILQQTDHSGGDIVVPWRTKHGGALSIHAEILPIKGTDKYPDSYIITLRDISRQTQNEDALRQAHENTELILNSLSAILIGINRHGEIDRWNEAAEDFFGYSETEVIGTKWDELTINWPKDDISQILNSKLVQNSPPQIDIERINTTGDRTSIQLTIHPIKPVHTDNASIGHLLLGLDTTEQTRMRMQLKQAQIGELASGVAKEINAPTEFIHNNLKFIEDAWNDLKSKEAT